MDVDVTLRSYPKKVPNSRINVSNQQPKSYYLFSQHIECLCAVIDWLLVHGVPQLWPKVSLDWLPPSQQECENE